MSLLSMLDAILDHHHEEVMDYIYIKYHYFNSPNPETSLTEVQKEELSFYDSLGGNLAENRVNPNGAARNKCIVFDRDPDFVNGLPRRRRF